MPLERSLSASHRVADPLPLLVIWHVAAAATTISVVYAQILSGTHSAADWLPYWLPFAALWVWTLLLGTPLLAWTWYWLVGIPAVGHRPFLVALAWLAGSFAVIQLLPEHTPSLLRVVVFASTPIVFVLGMTAVCWYARGQWRAQ